MVLEAALAAAQALLEAHCVLIRARIGIRRIRFGMQHNAGIEVDGAFGTETEALLLHRDMAGIAAVEILAERLDNAGADALAQCSTNVEILSRDAKRHDLPPLLFAGPW